MGWIRLTQKSSGITELVNTSTICRIYRHEDADPETLVVFVGGNRVAYRETQWAVEGLVRHAEARLEELRDVGS